ncbi:diguanylate cyclase [Vibrio sp. ZSDE26]|uniref:diguanylate cyclase n=1 Tax=Vibrio amylolyticus TaxID=2847292 RepID=A0A9X1XGF0_9VIBR|nr:diguanylate cyclase [Vibrio amylolyticus]MCK6261761.1 diguanylate cyclase [Vibrio amylolyticus]
MSKFISQQFISAKSVITIISWLFFTMAIAIVGILSYFLNSLDNQATLELSQRMELALQLENQHKESLIEEYTYWDTTYQKAIVEKDEQWVEDNTGGYLIDNKGFDFSLAIEQGEKSAYLVSNEAIIPPRFDELMRKGLAHMVESANELATRTKTSTGYFLLNDSLYIVVGGPLLSEETGSVREGTYLALGTKIDTELLSEFSINHQIPQLLLSFDSVQPKYGSGIYTPNGKRIGSFSWRPHRPSEDILPYVTMIVVTFSLVTIFVTRFILKKEQANRAAYEEKLFLEATQDSLTKIINRRYFLDIGRKEFTLYSNESNSLSVVVLDIDYFKEINDQFGHGVGDKALIHFTQICHQGLRESDIFGRIGGEEFSVILPNTDANKALTVANRIRTLLVDNPFDVYATQINMTVSIGVAVLDNTSDFDTLIEQADIALYKAKDNGRNTVVLYHPEMALADNN